MTNNIESCIEDGIEYTIKTNKFGDKMWFLNGKMHRESGPAYLGPDGTQSWWYHGEVHRLDGPALIRSNGDREWYYHYEWLKEIKSQQEYEQWLKLKLFQ